MILINILLNLFAFLHNSEPGLPHIPSGYTSSIETAHPFEILLDL